MAWLYHTLLYQPLYNLLMGLYAIIPGHDLGLAIIALTILVKVVFYPLSAKAIKSQQALQALQPKMDALRKQYKDNKEMLAQETMKLYRENKVNPLSSCLPLLIQLPFLIAVYQVFNAGLHNGGFGDLYSFIPNPGTVNTVFLGFLDLTAKSLPLAILAGVAQYVQTRMMTAKKAPADAKDGAKDENMMAEMNKSMMYFMPLMTIVIGSSFPGGLTLYWFLTTLLTIAQQAYLFNRKPIGAPTTDVVATPTDVIKVETTVKDKE